MEQFQLESRLNSSAEFTAVFKKNSFRASNKYLLLLARPNNRERSRLGMVVAKRHIPTAVQRNRIKRVLRESFRRGTGVPQGFDMVVLCKRGLGDLDNAAVANGIQDLWQKLGER